MQHNDAMDRIPPALGKRRYQRAPVEHCRRALEAPYGGLDDFDLRTIDQEQEPKTFDREQGKRRKVDAGGAAAARASGTRAPVAIENEGQSSNKKAKRTEPKAFKIGMRGQHAVSLREYVARQPEYQTLMSAGLDNDILKMIMEVGIKMDGEGLEVLFEEGWMNEFCNAIASINGSTPKEVRESKMKMVKKWKEQGSAERYFTWEEGATWTATNIKLTVQGKKNLLMHIDTDAEGLPHDIETKFRDETAQLINKVRHFSRGLRSHVQMANECRVANKQVHEESKKQFRRQVKLLREKEGLTEKEAGNKLRGLDQFLNRGLFSEKTTPDGRKVLRKDGTVVTYTAVEMAQAATGKTKEALYKRGLSEIANEPVHNAKLLQRTGMTYRMSAYGEDAVTAARAVGVSGGIDMMKLLGIDESDPESFQKFADVCYNKVTGIEHFGKQKQQQQLLQLENI